MFLHPLKSSAGFTYLAALMIVIIMGIMLGVAGQSWKMIMDREREAELLWVGTQYRNAIISWYKPSPSKVHRGQPLPLNDLKHLVEDPTSLQKIRHIRRLYDDPVSGKPFNAIKDSTGRIIGVASPSEKEPIKQANFPDEYADFEVKKKYSDWQFTNRDKPKKGTTGGVSGIPTTTLPTKSAP